MKLAGFLLLLSGWGIVLAALTLLKPVLPQVVFVLAGIAVVLGLVLVVRSHLVLRREREWLLWQLLLSHQQGRPSAFSSFCSSRLLARD